MHNSYTHALASSASLIGSELPVQLGSGPSFCSTPMPQGLSYVHQGHEPAKVVHKKHNAWRYEGPFTSDPGTSGPGLCCLSVYVLPACFYELTAAAEVARELEVLIPKIKYE
jgi:hypothetical protein